jgi:hypothetical protein
MSNRTDPGTPRSESLGESESIAVVVVLALVAFGGFQLFSLNRDLDSLKQRAQIAANPQDMLTYMRHLRENLVDRRATTGHTAIVFRTPANDLALHFQAVNSVIQRLEQLEGIAPDSAAYQAGLDDVRGIVREMPELAFGVFWVQFGWWLVIVGLASWCLLVNV